MYAAHNSQCKAGVAWYGKLTAGHGPLQVRNPIDMVADLHAPVLGLYGGLDTGIPLEDVRRMEAALTQGSAAAQSSEIVVYPDSGHAFYADYRPSRSEEHTSELQSLMRISYDVFCLKKKTIQQHQTSIQIIYRRNQIVTRQ